MTPFAFGFAWLGSLLSLWHRAPLFSNTSSHWWPGYILMSETTAMLWHCTLHIIGSLKQTKMSISVTPQWQSFIRIMSENGVHLNAAKPNNQFTVEGFQGFTPFTHMKSLGTTLFVSYLLYQASNSGVTKPVVFKMPWKHQLMHKSIQSLIPSSFVWCHLNPIPKCVPLAISDLFFLLFCLFFTLFYIGPLLDLGRYNNFFKCHHLDYIDRKHNFCLKSLLRLACGL